MFCWLYLSKNSVWEYLTSAFLTLLSKIMQGFPFIFTLKKYMSFEKVEIPIPFIFASSLVSHIKTHSSKFLSFNEPKNSDYFRFISEYLWHISFVFFVQSCLRIPPHQHLQKFLINVPFTKNIYSIQTILSLVIQYWFKSIIYQWLNSSLKLKV